jgi:hypothetical protein
MNSRIALHFVQNGHVYCELKKYAIGKRNHTLFWKQH